MIGYWLDDYDRSARLLPGLLAVAPLLVTALGLSVPLAVLPAGIGGALVALLAPIVVANYVRARGRALEQRLYDSWGGPPTTHLLAPAGGGGAVLAQRRANVERVTGVTLPADATGRNQEVYDTATLALRSKTGDRERFRLVYAENKGYGFERNLLGIRREGLLTSVTSVSTLALAAMVELVWGTVLRPNPLFLALTAACLLTVFWSTWPSPGRVRSAGDRYAERLIDAAGELG